MKLIFLDRDGVINKYPGDADYVKSWQEFQFLPNAKSGLKELNAAGFQIFVVSNQAGVSKGSYSQEDLEEITVNMLKELEKDGIFITGVHYCTHRDEDNCPCRKPKTGLVDMVLDQLKEEGIPPQMDESFFIGDTTRDIETGKRCGLKTILVFSGKENPENKKSWLLQPDFTASDLLEAARIILK
jgi:histidinol-phosphate phosphatase family protein